MLKKDSSFVEASLVLLVIFATLAYFVIFVQMSALIAILIVLMVLTGYVYWKDRSFDAIHKGMVEGIRPGIIPIVSPDCRLDSSGNYSNLNGLWFSDFAY